MFQNGSLDISIISVDVSICSVSRGCTYQYVRWIFRKAVGLDLSDMGIIYMYAGIERSLTEQQVIKMRECSVCRIRGSKDLFKKW